MHIYIYVYFLCYIIVVNLISRIKQLHLNEKLIKINWIYLLKEEKAISILIIN